MMFRFWVCIQSLNIIAAMQPHALEAFVHEYGIPFPVAVDAAADAEGTPIPKTM
jgi:hypothetical protein